MLNTGPCLRTSQFATLCSLLLRQGRLLLGAMGLLLLMAMQGHALAANDAAPSGTPTIPVNMTVGESYPITVTMKNTGTLSWTVAGNYFLALQNPSGWNITTIGVGTTIATNGTRAFTATMIAPSTPGVYNFQWCMSQGGTQFGTCSTPVAITVAARAPNAKFASQSMTNTLTTPTRAITVTMTNTGNTTWKAGQYAMGIQDPLDNTTWTITRLALGATIAPGANGTFSGTITAPPPGNYSMRWRMLETAGSYFGEFTPELTVGVAGAAPALDIDTPTANQSYIGNGGYIDVPVQFTGVPTGVATIKTTQVLYYNSNTLTYDPIATVDGPVFNQTLKRQAVNQTLYLKATDSFNKATMVGKNIVALVDNSQLVSHTVPTTMVPGQRYDVTMTLKNNGGTSWDPQTVTLAPYNALQVTNWGDFSLPLTAPVPPGGTAVFNTTLTPPSTEGSYYFQMRLDESTRAPFGAVVSVIVTVAHPPPTVSMTAPLNAGSVDIPANTTAKVRVQGSATPGVGANIAKLEILDGATVLATLLNTATVDQLVDLAPGIHQLRLRATDNWNKATLGTIATFTVKSNDATYSTQSIPATMQVGKTYTTSVTMVNSGTKPWSAAAGYALVSQNPTVWGVSRVAPTTTVNANVSYTFSIPLTAPSVPGTYNFQWQMAQDGVEAFGDPSKSVQVVVNPVAPTVGGLAGPLAGATFSAVAGKADVRVQGSATAGSGAAISKLEVLDGATVVATEDSGSIDMVVQLAGGAHTLKLRATDNFGQVVTGTVTTAITVQTNNASAVSRTVATTMVGGTSYPVTVVMRNSGTTTWTPAAGYALAPVPDNTAWVPSHIPLSTTVAPGADATFTFNVTAPQDPATYPFQWRMSQEGKEQFGTQSVLVNVIVTGVPPTVTLTAPVSGSVFTAANGSAAVTVQGTASATGSATINKFEVLDNSALRINAIGPTMDRVVTLTPGTHVLQLRVTDSRGAVTSSQQSTVTVRHNDAALVTQSVPTKMFTGQRYTLSFTVKNTGDTTWQPFNAQTGVGVALAEMPNQGGVWLPGGRVQLTNAVAPGQNYTFTFDVVAPATPNNYLFQWRMSDEGKELFGAVLANVQMPVSTPLVPVATLQSASPENQRVAPGQSGGIQVKGFATETGGLLTKLEVFADNGSGYGAAVFTGGGTPSPLGVLNAVITLPGGSYNLKLRATDSSGNFADSAPLRVNITDSSLQGVITGVRTTGAQQLQLVGWACRDSAAEALSYQVYVNAPPALGGTQVATGVANISGQADDANVQQQCHTPGTSHHFAVDLAGLQTQYPGAPLYVSASSTHGETIVLPCDDFGCRMPDAMRIGLTSPNANNQDHFRSPSPVFVRAVVTGNTGTVDEVVFNIDGQWVAGVSEGAGAYSVSKSGLPARAAPYIAYAKVRQGATTVITDEHLFYVDPGLLPGEVLPKSGSVVPLNQPTILSTVISPAVEPGQSVKFYIDPKTVQAMSQAAPLRQGGRSLRKMGGAAATTAATTSATTAAASVIGSATFDGTKWSYNWSPAQEGSYDVTAKLLDGAGAVLMQTPTATLTVSASANPGGPTPVPVAVVVPHIDNLNAGTLPGSLGVGPDGGATYSIPVVVPPGTAGMVPELALNYNSSGTNGVVGLGWSLSGMSSIHRCGKTIAQDGVNGRINFDKGDRLCIDGERLVLTNTALSDDAYWADNAVYRTEIDNFMRVSAQGSGAGRTFKAERKDGKVLTFGDASPTVNARVQGYVTLVDGVRPAEITARADAQSWALDKIVDRSGNFITFHYLQTKATGEHVIDAIRYGGNGLAPHAMVKFEYEVRTDSWTRYIDGTRHDLRQRASHIKTYVGEDLSGAPSANALVRDYALTYEASPTSGRSLLKQVAVSAVNPVTGVAESLPPTTFDWGKPDTTKTAGFVSRGTWSGAPLLTTHANSGFKSANHPDYFAFQDMENHGLADVLERRVASPADPAYAENPATAANPLWPGTMQQQYRYFHNNGNGFDQYQYKLDTNEKFAVLELGDFNGDGAPDLLVGTENAGPKICLSPLRNGIGATAANPIVFTCASAAERPAMGANSVDGIPYVVDVVGDGRSAIYGDIAATTHTASLYIQQEKLVDTDPPYAVLPYNEEDRRNTVSDTLQTFVTFDQAVDFAGIGKHADVRWALPYVRPQGMADNGEPIGSLTWVNLAPSVTITDFRKPGTPRLGGLRSYWLHDEYPAPYCVMQAFPDGNSRVACDPAPYRFDGPLPTGGAVADFSGSGYSNLMFGFVEINKFNSATRAEATLCLSTGRELDCGKLPQHSGDQYKVAQAIANFVGDGAPSVLMQETLRGTDTNGVKTVPVAVGPLQMCRLTGMGETPEETRTNCLPWAGLTLPGPAGGSTAVDQVYFMDLLGTGRTQAVYYHAGKYTGTAWQEDGRWEVLEPVDVAFDGQALDRIHQVTNGLGAVSNVEYRDGLTSGVVSRRGDTDLATAYPQRVALGAGKVVSRLKQANGVAGQHATSYRYFDPATDVAGRGSLGFGAVETTDEQSRIVTTTSYSHVWPKKGLVRSMAMTSAGGVSLASTTNTLDYKQFNHPNGEHTYLPFVAESVVDRRDLDNSDLGKVTTTNTYDDYGNVTKQRVSSTADNKTFVAEVASTFLNTDSSWLIGLPSTVTTTRTDPLSGTLARVMTYEYDPTTGLRTKGTVQSGERAYELITEYLRPSQRFGLVEETRQTWTDPLTLTPRTRSVKTAYDDKGRYPLAVTNAENLTERYQYVAGTGARSELSDVNQLLTKWSTDGFGRVQTEVRSDGNETRSFLKVCDFNLCPEAPSAAMVQIVEQFHGEQRIAVPVLSFSDSVGHLLRNQTYAFNGDATYSERHYDTRGRLTSTSQPAYANNASPALASSQEYDDLNRVVAVTVVDEAGANQTTRTEYKGLTTRITNPKNQTRTDLHNAIGQVVMVTDAMAGVTEFGYEPFGNLNKTIDPRTNVIKVEYDKWGRRTALNDPDLGRIEYAVDPLGRVRKQSSQVQRDGGQSTEIDYDKLDRMTVRKDADLSAAWTYDTALNGKGQLAETYTLVSTNKDYIRAHTYDAYGRPDSTIQTLSDAVYTSQMIYDAWGRVVTQQYQRGSDPVKRFDTRYNDKGYVSWIERNGLKLWSVSKQDAANRPTEVLLGNGLTQIQTYNVNSARLAWDQLKTATGDLRLDQGYTYDSLGNVSQRTQFWDHNGFIEEFGYDDLNRLTSSTLSGRPTRVFTYYADGSLRSKTGVGTGDYEYLEQGANAQRPHAVKSIAGGMSFSYDNNGNLSTAGGMSVVWNSFDMPKSISKNGYSSAFIYGSERQRVRQDRGDGTSIIYAGTQEVETKGTSVTVRTYWPMGIGLEIDSTDKPFQMNWIHKDRLGSPVALTGSDGTIVEKLAYDAWGKRREAGGSSTSDDIDGATDHRGFTGHEMLDQLDLVHMNGRIYDPLTAKFLSGDPLIQDPMNGQNYNRYSYVLNNPTNLTDPSGFAGLDPNAPCGGRQGCQSDNYDDPNSINSFKPKEKTGVTNAPAPNTVTKSIDPKNGGGGNPANKDTDNDPQAAPPGSSKVAGDNKSNMRDHVAELPPYISDALNKMKIPIVYVKYTVVEHFSELNNVEVPGREGQTYNTIPGVFYNRTVVLATDPLNWAKQSSRDFVYHEIGHAFDFAMGYLSRRQDFQTAWGNDNSRLPLAYYRNRAGEAYAETFARYHSGDKTLKKDWPQLYDVIQSFDGCKKGGFNGC